MFAIHDNWAAHYYYFSGLMIHDLFSIITRIKHVWKYLLTVFEPACVLCVI